ncbi:MAG: iron ABC transporter permease [Hellea sp.]|nr:iron ABC transporter permease [Hellea sp.]
MKIFLILLATALCFLGSLFFGQAELGLGEVIAALTGSGSELNRQIIWELRLPRAALALFVGAGLGASGAALQGFTRNGLAAPGILGFSACAALGAVAALYFGLEQKWIAPAALIGAGLGSFFILSITGLKKGANVMILAGVGIGALATALTGLIMNLAPNPWALSEIAYWLMGSLQNAELNSLWVCAPLTLLGIILLWVIAGDLKTLSLGELTAQSLGVSIARVQFILIAGVALCIGSGVAVAGAIGFVGLFVPHIMRLIFGPDPEKLILRSAIAGAGFLLLADMANRALSGPGHQLYLGIVTSLIGVPFFLWLVIKEVRA